MISTATAVIACFGYLPVFGHANESEATLASIETEREAHYEPCDAIVRFVFVNGIVTASDIKPAVCNKAPNTRQIIRQRLIPLFPSRK
jgi:hypothetical protein